jgi:hypothetical protein
MRIPPQKMSLLPLRLLGLLLLSQASVTAEIADVDPPGNYSARFIAHWQLQLDLTSCAGDFAPKRIHCLRGTTLANVEPLFDNVICTLVTDSTMECNDTSAMHFVNGFSGVEYDCQGTIFPSTRVEHESAVSYCNTTKSVAHLLQLSVVCENNETVSSHTKCADSNEIEYLDETYTCLSINTFDANAAGSLPMPEVVIYTDDLWTLIRPEGCFEFSPDASTLEPSLETTLASLTEAPSVDLPVPSIATTVAGAPTPTVSQELPTTTDVPTLESTASAAPFAIPEGTIYSAMYVGRFQQVLSEGCQNAAPGLVLTCAGEIVNVETSDPSIECGVESYTLSDGRSAILCENTCSDSTTDCEDVFLSTDAIESGPVGQIFFQCQGESTDATDGTFIIIEEAGGICTGTDPDGKGLNLNIVQLGVSCPNGDGEWSHVVDDLHADCRPENLAMNVLGNYSCFSGLACGAEPCQVDFVQLVIAADPYRYPECITTNNGSPVPIMAPPEVPDMADGNYSAQFLALWFFIGDSSCIPGSSLKHAICTNGNIRLLESFVEGDPCVVISDNTIECSDTGLNGQLFYVSGFECPAAVALIVSSLYLRLV